MTKYRKKLLLTGLALFMIGAIVFFDYQALFEFVDEPGLPAGLMIGSFMAFGLMMILISIFPNKMRDGLNSKE